VFGKTTLARCKKKTLSNLSPEKDLIGPAILTDISIKDRNNPIGNIVQGHTNLTEIKLAAELLWRVGVKPEQVALGYGFYGRAFELRDAACSTPGCTFKGGTREGPCSKESGILMHYEIKAILDQAPNLKPIWDKEAAVKYLVFDKNQWVSYDDKDTFGQKIAWANSVGFDGALLSGRGSAPTTSCSQKGTYNQWTLIIVCGTVYIVQAVSHQGFALIAHAWQLLWAADTDDDKFTAMSGFLNKYLNHITVESTALEANAITIAQTYNALSGKGCSLYKDGGCHNQEDFDNNHVRCPNGNPPIGYDKDGCKVSDQTDAKVAKYVLIHDRAAENRSPAKATYGLQNAHVGQLEHSEVEYLLIYDRTGRGGGGDCNGQCHAGEQKIHGSSWLVAPLVSRHDCYPELNWLGTHSNRGGGYESESDVKKCTRGGKAFL
jgi:hypothetical protein